MTIAKLQAELDSITSMMNSGPGWAEKYITAVDTLLNNPSRYRISKQILNNTYAMVPLHCYTLEPGDGNIYRFGFVHTDHARELAFSRPDSSQSPIVDSFFGLGDLSNYVMVYVERHNGITWTYFSRWDLKTLSQYAIADFAYRLSDVDPYTAGIIAMALQVLIENPMAIEAALVNMQKEQEDDTVKLCPHGFENSDQCPQCRH